GAWWTATDADRNTPTRQATAESCARRGARKNCGPWSYDSPGAAWITVAPDHRYEAGAFGMSLPNHQPPAQGNSGIAIALANLWAGRFMEATRPLRGEVFGMPIAVPPTPPDLPWPPPPRVRRVLAAGRRRYHREPPCCRPSLEWPQSYLGLFQPEELSTLGQYGWWARSGRALRGLAAHSEKRERRGYIECGARQP